jgi:hypothetical protein
MYQQDGDTDWIHCLTDEERYELIQEIWTNLTSEDKPGKKDIKELCEYYIERDADSVVAEYRQCEAENMADARRDNLMTQSFPEMNSVAKGLSGLSAYSKRGES